MDWTKIKAMREDLGSVTAEAEALITNKTTLTAEEQKSFDEKVAKAEEIKASIKRFETVAALCPSDAQALGRDEQPGTHSRIVMPSNAYRGSKLTAYTKEEDAYKSGLFFAAALFGNESARERCRQFGIKNALTGNDNSLGGYLVPDELERAVIDLREEYGVIRRYANVVPMSSDTKTQPVRNSGLTAHHVGAAGSIADSDKSWTRVQLVAKKIAATTIWSSELDEDSILSIGNDLTQELAYAFAIREDDDAFNGNGEADPYGGIRGILESVQAGSVVQPAAASGRTGFETLTLADFEACVGRLPQYAGMQPAWFISHQGWVASMQRLLDAAGGNTMAMLSAGPSQLSFLGYPVVKVNSLNRTLGPQASQKVAVFGDLRLATVMGNRRGMRVTTSEHVRFSTDELVIRGTERYDFVCHSTGTASAPGAVVVLKTASS